MCAATAVITATQVTQPPLMASLNGACRVALVELEEILIEEREKLQAGQSTADDLTLSLFEWGAVSLWPLMEDTLDLAGKKLSIFVRGQIRILSGEILVDPLSCLRPLRKPLKERDWTLEEETRSAWMEIFPGASPLDDQPWEAHPLSHLFAIKMISWLQKVQSLMPPSTSMPGGRGQEVSCSVRGSSSASKIGSGAYIQIVTQARFAKQARKFRRKLQAVKAETEKKMEELFEKMQKNVEEEKARRQKHDDMVNQRLDSIEESRKAETKNLEGKAANLEESLEKEKQWRREEVKSLGSRIDEGDKLLTKTRELVELEEEKNAQNEKELGSLKGENAGLRQEVAHLRHEVANADSGICSVM